MTAFDPFLKSKVENSDFCCSGEPHKPLEPKVHMVPGIGSPAPSWSSVAIVDSKIKKISLKDYRGKYLILLFYPYDFTFICPSEMIQFSDRIEELKKSDCEMVAISTDSEYSHLAWIMTPRKQGGLGEMRIAVLSDKSHEISKLYGVLDETEGISLKGLFIIDKKQLIRHVAISEISLSRSVDETLRIVEACKFIDEYGETCPAGPRKQLAPLDHELPYFTT